MRIVSYKLTEIYEDGTESTRFFPEADYPEVKLYHKLDDSLAVYFNSVEYLEEREHKRAEQARLKEDVQHQRWLAEEARLNSPG